MMSVRSAIGAAVARARFNGDGRGVAVLRAIGTGGSRRRRFSGCRRRRCEQKVRALVAQITPDRIKRDIEFRKASALFPQFCEHWGQDLHDREVNNLSNLKFVPKDGYETTTYTGYGKISGCESHQSKDGYSIGKITYEEFVYYLAGKSEDEARHALPKPISDLHTTEIFRWDNGKWFY